MNTLWLVIFFIPAFFISYVIMRELWKRQINDALTYHFEFTAEEVFAGEYLYLDQLVINNTDKTIPYIKTETLLPQGLKVVLTDSETQTEELLQSVQSVFSLPPRSQVSRRWRLVTETRGTYTAQSVQVIIVSHDATGTASHSRQLHPEPSLRGTLTVLPAPAEWLTQMALAPSYTGERTTPQGLIFDPMTVCGIREYQTYDALNTVDWKQSARLGRMMVRKTEVQQNDSYNLVLNMQSIIVEPRSGDISAPAYIEDCISLCASLLDSAVRRNIPVRLMANTPPGEHLPGCSMHEGTIGSQIFQSEEFSTKNSLMDAYRILAKIPMVMSVPFERLLDDMTDHPERYARGGHIVMVSAFLNQRMVNFHRVMKEREINVIFYVVTAYQNALDIPPDVEAYFRISQWVGGVGYAS